MYGYRARIGVLIPSTNTVVEPEFWRMAPEGVSIHTARMKLTVTTPQSLTAMSESLERAADEVSTAEVDVIVYACTSGSFVGGVEWETNLVKRLSTQTGITSISTSRAVMHALKALKVKTIAMATPYIADLNRLEESFFEANGLSVVKSKCLGISKNVEIGALFPENAYRLAKEAYDSRAEAIFISCTDFRTIEIITHLESEFQIPVITSNQASIWAALRVCNIRDALDFGSLFKVEAWPLQERGAVNGENN